MALVLLGGLLAGMEWYTRTPDTFAIEPLQLPADTRSVVLIFHGSQDGGDPVLADIAARIRSLGGGNVAVVDYQWSPASDNRLRAAANARELGITLGRELAALPALEQLHLIAHSAGAFVPDSICRSLRAARNSPPRIETTYLDPFGIDGFVDWNYGARHHGECADQALAIINRNDPAPATNTPLRQACNIDVTGLPGSRRLQRNGHYWPLQYFLESFEYVSQTTGLLSQAQDCPRGMVLDQPPDQSARSWRPGG